MSAGMMPTFDRPGEVMPGQFGPMIRVRCPRRAAYAQAYIVSWTGIPSVMTTSKGIPASIASSIAAFAPAGGTNPTATSAPVSAIASATVAKTGSLTSSNSTKVPAFRGFVPPTIVVPARSIRWVCLLPSDPVMPWTMTRLVRSTNIAIECAPCLPCCRGEFGHPPRGIVHGLHLFDARQLRRGQNCSPFGRPVSVKPDDQRDVDAFTSRNQILKRGDNSTGDGIARGNTAEDIHQHRPHCWIRKHHRQSGGHHLRGGPAADVEEIRRAYSAVRFAGVRHDVECAHHQPGAVADDTDLAVQFHVMEPGCFCLRFQWIRGARVGEPCSVGMAKIGVVVEGHLAVECDQPVVEGADQGIDLDKAGVLGLKGLPQASEDPHRLVADRGGKANVVGD